jgi:hypothetical protein
VAILGTPLNNSRYARYLILKKYFISEGVLTTMFRSWRQGGPLALTNGCEVWFDSVSAPLAGPSGCEFTSGAMGVHGKVRACLATNNVAAEGVVALDVHVGVGRSLCWLRGVVVSGWKHSSSSSTGLVYISRPHPCDTLFQTIAVLIRQKG